jgi:hypothetical protein
MWNSEAILSSLYKDAVSYYDYGAGDRWLIDFGALEELRRWQNTEALREKPAPLLHQMIHMTQSGSQSRTSAVNGRRLTAWAMAGDRW